MVSGTLLHVGTKGPEDKFLYGNPKMTFFKNVFVKSRNFVLEYSKIPKSDGSIDLGRTFRIKIPKSGDLLAGIYIDFKLKDLKSRTKNCLLAKIENPDDELMFALILKNLSDRQITLDKKLIDFIIKRVERSYGKIFEFIYKIDNISLKKKKSIDFKIINEALEK